MSLNPKSEFKQIDFYQVDQAFTAAIGKRIFPL